MWKITNIADKNIKFSISIAGNINPGIILKPNQFCITRDKLTAPMDKQIRSGFLMLEESFDNSQFEFPLGEAFDLSELEKKEVEAKKYMKS